MAHVPVLVGRSFGWLRSTATGLGQQHRHRQENPNKIVRSSTYHTPRDKLWIYSSSSFINITSQPLYQARVQLCTSSHIMLDHLLWTFRSRGIYFFIWMLATFAPIVIAVFLIFRTYLCSVSSLVDLMVSAPSLCARYLDLD